MRTIVSDELNRRDIGGGMHHATQILGEIRNVHAEVLEITKDIKNNIRSSRADTPAQKTMENLQIKRNRQDKFHTVIMVGCMYYHQIGSYQT